MWPLVRELLRAIDRMSIAEREALMSDLNGWILAGHRRRFHIVRSAKSLNIHLNRNRLATKGALPVDPHRATIS